jgi:hypothetical protein
MVVARSFAWRALVAAEKNVVFEMAHEKVKMKNRVNRISSQLDNPHRAAR